MMHKLSNIIITHKTDKNGKLRKIPYYKIEKNFVQFLEFCGWSIDNDSGEITHPNIENLYYCDDGFISREDDDRVVFAMIFNQQDPFKNMYADDETWELIYKVNGLETRIKLK